MSKKRQTAERQPTSPIQTQDVVAPRTWRQRLLLDEKHASLWGAVAVVVAVIAIVAGYVTERNRQTRAEAAHVANVTYAVSIMPNPPPGEDFKTTNYWGVNILVWNSGPATANTLVLHLHTPSPDVFLHSAPEIISAPPVATMRINERTPAGIYEVVLQNFSPGEFCGVRLGYRAEGELAKLVHEDRDNGGLFSPNLAKHFIKQFWFTGESIAVHNVGALDVQQTFPAK